MKSKTKIKAGMKRKMDSYIVETVLAAKKHKEWLPIARIVSGPTRDYSDINLKEIELKADEGDTIIVPGKILGTGDISKKIRICALYFSENAREKLKKNKSEIATIIDEIKKNPKAEGVKILRVSENSQRRTLKKNKMEVIQSPPSR